MPNSSFAESRFSQSPVVAEKLKEWEQVRLGQGVSPSVMRNMKSAVVGFRAFVNRQGYDLDSTDQAALQRMLKDFSEKSLGTYLKPISKNTILWKLSAIRSFYNWLAKRGYLPEGWLDFGEVMGSRRSPEERTPTLGADQIVESILSFDRSTTIGVRDFAVILSAIWSSYDFKGVIGATWQDFHPQENFLVVSGKEVDLHPVVTWAIRHLVDRVHAKSKDLDAPLFPNLNSHSWMEGDLKPITEAGLYAIISTRLGPVSLKRNFPSSDLRDEFRKQFDELGLFNEAEGVR